MRGSPWGVLLAIGALTWCGVAGATEAVIDDQKPGADFAPSLRLMGTDELREDHTTYDHQELMCEGLGYCPPPPPKGFAAPPHESMPGKGLTFHLERPKPAPTPPVYSHLEIPHVAADVANLDPVIVYGQPTSPWYGEVTLSKIERSLPCLGCKGTDRGPSIALAYGVDLLFTVLRGFFQQPHVRGEPNDEALSLAACAIDGDIRCANPQLP